MGAIPTLSQFTPYAAFRNGGPRPQSILRSRRFIGPIWRFIAFHYLLLKVSCYILKHIS